MLFSSLSITTGKITKMWVDPSYENEKYREKMYGKKRNEKDHFTISTRFLYLNFLMNYIYDLIKASSVNL